MFQSSLLRIGDAAVSSRAEVSLHLLSALRPLRGGVLGRLPDPPRGGARQDGDAHHPLPRAHQHLQHRDIKLPQRGGHDGNRRLDAWLVCIVVHNIYTLAGVTFDLHHLLVCIFFVFGALVGYAYLLWKKKKSCLKRKKNKKQTEDDIKLKQLRKEDYRLAPHFIHVMSSGFTLSRL